MGSYMGDQKRSNWRLYLTVFTFAALGVLIYSLRHQITDAIKELGQINAVALLFIIPLKLINFDVYARLYKDFFATLGSKVSHWSMYKLTMELNFVNYILPSGGVSGISYFTIRARSEGVSAAKATLVQITKLFLLFVSFQPLLVLGVFILSLYNHASGLVLVIATSLITLLIVGTMLGVYIIESRQRISRFLTAVTKLLNRAVRLVRPKSAEAINISRAQEVFEELHDNYQIFRTNLGALKRPFLYTMIANVTEIASLYVVYIAFGEYVNIGAVILAYAVANFAGLISVLPAGIGIYEGLMTAVLVATGIPAGLSISVTIMFRIVTMFIQLPPGYFFYQKAVRSGLGARV